jgi:hypothetical protein
MAAQRVTLWNPVTGLPWDCPAGAVDYWVNERGFSKSEPRKAAPSGAESKKGDA